MEGKMGIFKRVKKEDNAVKSNNNYIEKQHSYFGKIIFNKIRDKEKLEAKINNINFCNKNLEIKIYIGENSNIENILNKLEMICFDSDEFINKNMFGLVNFCNSIDLYDNDDRQLETISEDILKEIYMLKRIYVETNSINENLIEIVGSVFDNIEQEIAIVYNCHTDEVTFELL